MDEETKHRDMAILAGMRDSICQEVTDELDAIMQRVLADAISLCPVDTGALRSSISLEGGAISRGSDFYEASIYAGSPDIINPKSLKPTSEYAEMVESGHALPDGSFWESAGFLSQAIQMHENELEAAVEKALKSLGETEPSGSDVARQSD